MNKTPLLISVFALIVSIGSIIYTVSSSSKKSTSQQEIDAAVDEALKAREQVFINAYRPKFSEMYEGTAMNLGQDWKPESLEELFDPMIRMINDFDE